MDRTIHKIFPWNETIIPGRFPIYPGVEAIILRQFPLKIVIKLFQASSDAEGTRSKLNKYSGLEFVISGMDVQKFIPQN